MEMEYGKIYHVPNAFASQLHFSDFNRDINESQVKKLTKSMQAEGYWPCKEIQIDKNLNVIDGHHRLEAVRRAGVGFDVVMCDITASPELLQNINSGGREWSNLDTISSLSKGGSAVHQRCVILLNKYVATRKLSSAALMFACTGKVKVKDLNAMAEKDFKLMMPYKKIMATLDTVVAILDTLPVKKCAAIEKALIVCVRCSGISTIRLKNQLEKYGEKIKKCTDVGEALSMIESVYNYRAKTADALDFFELTGFERE